MRVEAEWSERDVEPRCFCGSGEGSKALLAGLVRCRNLKDPITRDLCTIP